MVSAAPPQACPEAGTNLHAEAPSALPVGARVAEFEIRGVLGSGGFGIVYLAWDHALEREVAVKEYMPGTLADRGGDLSVSVRSNSMADTFALGLRSFVNEARLLARFDHPSLVKVYRFWEDNGTAYMVMPFYKGRTLRKVRAGMVIAPGEGACRKVLDALLSALEVLHKEGVFHRDIAPDNILIGDDGAPVLLDFGAARRVIEGGAQKALTSIMKPHFAPLEQYADQSAMRQGPWTDLYALGGTIYFLLTGREPVPAASRALHDDQPRLGEFGLEEASPHFLATIDWMMAIRPPERPQSVHMLRDVLEGRITVPGRAARERTQPGVNSRNSVDILTSPGDLSPDTGTGSSDAASPTVLMPRVVAAPEPLPQPATANAAAPAQESLLPRRSSVAVLAALVVANVLAWWWYTRGDAPTRAEPAPVARSAAVPATTTAAASAAAPSVISVAASAPVGATRPADSGGNETILSVLPARAPRTAATAASAPTIGAAASAPARSLDAPLPRSAPLDAAAPRVADATAGRNVKPVTVESNDPRARCGERNFFSMQLCIKRECQNPAVSAHAECVKLREQEAAQISGSDR